VYPPEVTLPPSVGESWGSIFLEEGLVKWRGNRGDWTAVLPNTGHEEFGTGDEPNKTLF